MQAMDSPEVSRIKAHNLGVNDMVNLVLQRSEIIRDQPKPNRFIKAWVNGNDAPLLDLVEKLGADELVRRAAAFIYLEFQKMKPFLTSPAPRKVADIGCGYALFDLFLAREYDADLVLIDIEANEKRHFGFEKEGAAYSSLAQTRDFLIANGVEAGSIELRNPQTDSLSDIKELDYIFSFISCGFHYPWDTYLDFYDKALSAEGRVILDLRARKFAEALPEISKFGFARHLAKAANGSADRIMFMKAA
ncbi:class I SAM-dependent methyltransferase [Yoonia sp.]|uniref:class I SAM-dependent methyltransferase n=1 Tax=Yoonia sp. TaxID=2212373 RepID=UPI00391D5E89